MMNKYSVLFFIVLCTTRLVGQDLSPKEIVEYVISQPKPETSIVEIRLEVTRKKEK